MAEEPKGTTLTGLDEIVCMQGGTPVSTLHTGKQVTLTRRLAVARSLETHSDTERGDKFKAFDLGMRFESANGQIAIDASESVMIQNAVEKEFPQPGIYVPMCRWLEGGATEE